MMTKLEILLEKIDPSETIQPYSKISDNAINTFKLEKATVNTKEQFITCIRNFNCHFDKVSWNRKVPANAIVDGFFCREILGKVYGQNWERIAFRMAQTGIDGGLYAVLKSMAAGLADFYARGKIRNAVHDFMLNLTADERIASGKEYYEKYAHLIPASFAIEGIFYLTCYLRKVLEEHPHMIQRRREVGR